MGVKKPAPLPTPTVTDVKAPVVNQELVNRQTADIMRRRKGAAATILTDDGGSTSGSVAAKTLLGQ